MATYVIQNRVLSAEEMGRRLGLTRERVDAVRSIMNAPVPVKASKRAAAKSHTRRKSTGKRTPSQTSQQG